MSRDDFWRISSMFHLADNRSSQAKSDKLHKTSNFQNIMQDKWKKYYRFSPNLNLDEAMIPFTGRLSFLQYIRGKPIPWGIKAYILASSSTGYIYRMHIYSGKNKDIINTQQLVEYMVEDLSGSSYMLYIDNYYTSPKLLQSLREKSIRCTGTLRKNRLLNKPLCAKISTMSKGEIKFYTNEPEKNLTLAIWKDKREVLFLSNHRQAEKTQVLVGVNQQVKEIPTMRIHYNDKARGVDNANKNCNVYRYNHAEKKWWKKIFEQIVQITLSNIYIIYKHLNSKPKSKFDCHMEIITYLIHNDQIEKPLKLKHYLDWVPLKKKYLSEVKIEDSGQQSNKKDFRLTCKNKNCSKKSDLHCVGCTQLSSFICVLCVPICFIEYHENKF